MVFLCVSPHRCRMFKCVCHSFMLSNMRQRQLHMLIYWLAVSFAFCLFSLPWQYSIKVHSHTSKTSCSSVKSPVRGVYDKRITLRSSNDRHFCRLSEDVRSIGKRSEFDCISQSLYHKLSKSTNLISNS